MGEIHDRADEDPDVRSFRTDVDKYYTITAEGRRGPAQRLRLWMWNADFRVVACYRLDRAARRYQAEHQLTGLPARVFMAVWRRRVMNIHHADIDHRAQIGPGLFLMHHTGVFIGPVTIGDNCVLHHNVTIGQRVASGDHGVPRLGDDVWIGPGATITGDVTIGDGATISAGSVVSRDVPARALVAGNPGRVIASDYDNSAMLNYRVRRPVPAHEAPASPAVPETAAATETPETPTEAERLDSAHVDRALAEYARLRDPQGDRHLEAVKAAIFLEDVFRVVLREEQIDPDLLDTAEGMRAVLAQAGEAP
ncbi:MAG TPA: serine acetyltransferase [Nocardioides sp.]|nr:serine acetyltransferase [Nocardioides sp.]